MCVSGCTGATGSFTVRAECVSGVSWDSEKERERERERERKREREMFLYITNSCTLGSIPFFLARTTSTTTTLSSSVVVLQCIWLAFTGPGRAVITLALDSLFSTGFLTCRRGKGGGVLTLHETRFGTFNLDATETE
eukprot:TRINITY_DN2852_c0_g1_i7.p1 TRINITY_DN2852_c0_g1~~TRINITY_DN2852_c0_g1_i7.p1  ORF type:complete len:137 (-),score=12.65 TRINITY_DN2852_c0_g1_i7:169-579(-)